MLRLLLAIAIVLLPNALHVSLDTGIPGLNFSNLLLLVLLAALAMSPAEPAPSMQRGFLTPPLLFLFATLVIGFFIAQADDQSDALANVTRLKDAIFYPSFYFIYRRCRLDLRHTRQLIMLVLLVALVAAVEAIQQGIQFGGGKFVDTQRASGPFGGLNMANRAGAFYAMFLPMLAAVAVLFKRKVVRVAALVGCVLLATAILFTYSRQSYLIALVGLLILLLHRNVLAAVLAGLLLLVSVSFFPASVIERVEQTRQTSATGTVGVDQSTASRLQIWEGALDMWREHPAGIGLGRFSARIGNYSPYRGKDAHNAFVLMLAECGVLGLAAIVWLLWRLWRMALLLRRSAATTDVETRALALGFKITVISVALSNIYGSPFFEGLVMTNFWVLCGLLERYATLKAGAPESSAALQFPSARIADRFPLAVRAMPGVRTTPTSTPR